MRSRVALLLALLAGCAAPPVPQRPEPAPAPAPSAAPSPAPAAPVARRPGRPTKPMAVKPLSLTTACSFADETGYHGSAKLEIADSVVRSLQAMVTIPGRGQCSFDASGYTQTRLLPSIELRARKGGCIVQVWEQGEQVTVAFSECRSQCKPASAFAHVWPILIDRSSGACD